MDLSKQVQIFLTELQMKLAGVAEREAERSDSLVNRLCDVYPVKTRNIVMPMIGGTPGMRQWKGTKEVREIMNEDPYIATVVDYEETIGINKHLLEDADSAIQVIWEKLMKKLPNDYTAKRAKAVMAAVEAGFSALGPDNQYFFDQDHVFTTYATNQSNDCGGAGDSLVGAFSEDNLWAIINRMKSFKDDRGELMGIEPDLLLLPPALEKTGRTVLKATRGNYGQDNVTEGVVDYASSGLLSSSTDYYLFSTPAGDKPLTLFEREKPSLVWKNKPNDDNVFFDGQIIVGIEARFVVAYGDWYRAIGVDVA